MSRANVTWGAPRVRNELAKLGIEVAVSTVARYMVKQRKPSSPSWRAFLDNHVKDLVAIDFFTVPTATFGVLFGFLVLAHGRRRVLHFNVTANPSAEWTARQLVQAFPEETAPRFLVRDRDGIYGDRVRRTLEVLGIEEWSRWRGPRGRTRSRRGSSVRCAANVWTTSSSSASSISSGSWPGISSTTTGRAVTCH